MDAAANAEKRRVESSAIAAEKQGLQPSNAVSFRAWYRLSAHTGVHCRRYDLRKRRLSQCRFCGQG